MMAPDVRLSLCDERLKLGNRLTHSLVPRHHNWAETIEMLSKERIFPDSEHSFVLCALFARIRRANGDNGSRPFRRVTLLD